MAGLEISSLEMNSRSPFWNEPSNNCKEMIYGQDWKSAKWNKKLTFLVTVHKPIPPTDP